MRVSDYMAQSWRRSPFSDYVTPGCPLVAEAGGHIAHWAEAHGKVGDLLLIFLRLHVFTEK